MSLVEEIPEGIEKVDSINLNPQTRKLMLHWQKKENMERQIQFLDHPDRFREIIQKQFDQSPEKKTLEQNYFKKCDYVVKIFQQEFKARVIILRPKKFDIYDKPPALIYAHGLSTSLDVSKYEMSKLAIKCNCVVIGIDYKTPQYKNPGLDQTYEFKGQRDFLTLIQQVYFKPQDFKVDKYRIIIAGGSTGAWITLGAARLLIEENQKSFVKLMILACPDVSMFVGDTVNKCPDLKSWEKIWADYNFRKFHLLSGIDKRKLFENSLKKQSTEEQSRLFPGRLKDFKIEDLPKTILVTAEYDCFKRDAQEIKNYMKDNIIAFKEFKGLHHAFYNDSNIEETEVFFNFLGQEIGKVWNYMKQQEEETLIRQKTIKIMKKNQSRQVSVDLPIESRNNDPMQDLKKNEQNTQNDESKTQITGQDNLLKTQDQEHRESQQKIQSAIQQVVNDKESKEDLEEILQKIETLQHQDKSKLSKAPTTLENLMNSPLQATNMGFVDEDQDRLQTMPLKMQRQHTNEITGVSVDELDKMIEKKSQSPSAASLRKISKTESYLEEQQKEDDIQFDKDFILKLPSNLRNLVQCLHFAFGSLNHVENKDVIIAIGNTGCGKSTLLNSLIHGPEVLEEKTIQEKILVNKNGKTIEKFKKKTVIDVRKEYIESPDDMDKFFGIGHSLSQSETFMPVLFPDEDNDVTWTDVAGLNDTGGEMVSYINSFVIKQLFQRAKQVKFLVPLTNSQMTESRGQSVREQTQVIVNLCSSLDINPIASIQPILTKVKPNESDFDLDERKGTLAQQLSQVVQNQKDMNPKLKLDCTNDPDGLEEQNKINLEIEQQLKFYQEFAYKIVLFDPLDRDVPADDDQATKRDELLDQIDEMKYIEGSQLNVPMSNSMFIKLEQMFKFEQVICHKKAKEFLNHAKNEGVEFKKDFKEVAEIKNYYNYLQFFLNHRLISDIDQKIQKHDIFVKNTLKMINNAQEYHLLSDIGKQVYNNIEKIMIHMQKEEFEQLVASLAKLYDMVFNLRNMDKNINIEQQAEMDLHINRGLRNIEDIVTAIGKEPKDLIRFAYELRKFDSGSNKYSYEFLNGQIKPQLMIDIIMSNEWNSKTSQMEVKKQQNRFKMYCGSHANLLVNHSQRKSGESNSPIVVKKIEIDEKEDMFELILTLDGIIIKQGDSMLITAQEVEQESTSEMIWLNVNKAKQKDRQRMIWQFIQQEQGSNDPYFHIQKAVGHVKPRLIQKKKNFIKKCEVITTTKNSSSTGYDSSEQAVWRIQPSNQL